MNEMNMKKIVIEAGPVRLHARLNASGTARAISGILPVAGTANIWGDEIYFSLPLHMDEDHEAIQEVEIGDLAFWPAGDAFCIFFGRTPVSTGEAPRAFSPVNVFGKILGDTEGLKNVKDGDPIKVSLADESE
jgi:hypothetical protein